MRVISDGPRGRPLTDWSPAPGPASSVAHGAIRPGGRWPAVLSDRTGGSFASHLGGTEPATTAEIGR